MQRKKKKEEKIEEHKAKGREVNWPVDTEEEEKVPTPSPSEEDSSMIRKIFETQEDRDEEEKEEEMGKD